LLTGDRAFGLAIRLRRAAGPEKYLDFRVLGALAFAATIWLIPYNLQLLALGGLALALFVLVPLLWREGYTWAILWLAPLAVLEPIPAPAIRLAKYALVALAIIIAVAKRRLCPRRPGAWDERILLTAAGFLAWIWIRALTGHAPWAGTVEALRLTVVSGLVYMWLSEPARAGGRRRWYSLWMAMALFGVGTSVVEVWSFGVTRSYGTFENANSMGAYLMLSFALAFAAAHWAPGLSARRWGQACCAAILIALYLTGSRASWLGTATVALVVLLVTWNWRVLALGLGVCAAFLALYTTQPKVRFDVTAALRLGSGLTHRPILWAAAREAWSRSFLIGHGVDAAGEEMERAARYPTPIDRVLVGDLVHAGSAHNFYLEMLAETGLIGLLLLLSMVSAILRTTWQARQNHDRWRATYALAAFAVTLGILVHSFFERSVLLGLMSYTAFYWFLVAQAMRAGDPQPTPNRVSA